MLGQAKVNQVFEIHESHNKSLKVAGVKVNHGELERKNRYRLVRDGKVLQDKLRVHSMKKVHDNINHISKGLECGIGFDNLDCEI